MLREFLQKRTVLFGVLIGALSWTLGYAFISSYALLGDDRLRGPMGHIRNSRFVVSVYAHDGGWAGDTGYQSVAVTDLLSRFRNERTILGVSPQGTAKIASYRFIDQATLQVKIDGIESRTLELNLNDEELDLYLRY